MTADLAPLPYHTAIASRLETLERQSWAVFARAVHDPGRPSASTGGGTVSDGGTGPSPAAAGAPDDLEAMLLRHAYRMEPEAHPRVHAAARRAASALGLALPIAIYQLEGTAGGANAALAYRPHEAVLALSGNLLALLTDDELVACFGHELAHHVLWSADDRRLQTAARFLDALALDASSPPVFLETARRFDLATELFADRGALAACESLDVAVASLVKVTTGLAEVDPRAYLRQAETAHPERGAAGTTHPETVLRAWALARHEAGEGAVATETLLAPALDIERLDVLDRERLEALTRTLIGDALAVEWLRTDALTAHARQFLVDTSPSARSGAPRRDRGASTGPSSAAAGTARTNPAEPPVVTRVPASTPTETRRFLAYVLLDLATVDAELEDEPLVEVLAVARVAGIGPTFEEVARKELTLGQRAWDGVVRRAATRRTAAPRAENAEPEPTGAPTPDSSPAPDTSPAPDPSPTLGLTAAQDLPADEAHGHAGAPADGPSAGPEAAS